MQSRLRQKAASPNSSLAANLVDVQRQGSTRGSSKFRTPRNFRNVAPNEYTLTCRTSEVHEHVCGLFAPTRRASTRRPHVTFPPLREVPLGCQLKDAVGTVDVVLS